MEKLPVVCLMGPTASGKTQLAVQLVQQFPFEIISVDSAMVYRDMDIGTAKPGPDILTIAPHHLINIRDPRDAYSAAQFREDALREISIIHKKEKIPLLVGGTMLYFRTLQQGIALMPSANVGLRLQLSHEAEKLGWPALHNRLATIDPVAAQRIHPHDSQRIQRALEVHALTGKNVTTWHDHQDQNNGDYTFYNLVIAPQDRTVLHERIHKRFLQMLEAGLIDEVKKLYARDDLNLEKPAIRSVGYKQVWEYLQGKLTLDEMRNKSIIATRQLAKRQLTWLRSWPNAIWFDSEADDLFSQITAYLKNALRAPHPALRATFSHRKKRGERRNIIPLSRQRK
jgi:tRNA dimethylallyltransferase